MSCRTIFLSRFIGLFLILIALPMFWQSRLVAETADSMIHNRPLILLLGIIQLACGLAIVLLHNYWSGGHLTIVVTLLGWIMLLKGLSIVLLPPETMINLFGLFHIGTMILLYAAIDLVIGVYLTYFGFNSAPPTPALR